MRDIIEYCPIAPPYGGVTVYVKRLVERLRHDGFSVGGFYTEECTDLNVIGARHYYLFKNSTSPNRLIRLFAQFRRMASHTCHISGYKMVHYHGLENLKFIWFLKRIFGKSIIITVHSAMIESFYRRTDRVNKYFMKKLAESTDVQWVAVSSQAKECMQRLPFTFGRDIEVIPAYIPNEIAIFSPLFESLNEYINSHDKILTFYARSFMDNDGEDVYGFSTILKLYKRIIDRRNDNVGLVLCLSDTSEPHKIEDLRLQAQNLRIEDKIYWQIGAIGNMTSLWLKTDVYVRPTSTDGDSVAIREVIDLGVPVVTSDVCPRPDKAIVYPFNDMDSLTDKVIKALDMGKSNISYDYKYYNSFKGIINTMLAK